MKKEINKTIKSLLRLKQLEYTNGFKSFDKTIQSKKIYNRKKKIIL